MVSGRAGLLGAAAAALLALPLALSPLASRGLLPPLLAFAILEGRWLILLGAAVAFAALAWRTLVGPPPRLWAIPLGLDRLPEWARPTLLAAAGFVTLLALVPDYRWYGPPSGDEPKYLRLAWSLYRDLDLDIASGRTDRLSAVDLGRNVRRLGSATVDSVRGLLHGERPPEDHPWSHKEMWVTGWGGGIYYLQGAGLPVLLVPAIALGSDEPPEGRMPALVFVTLALLWSFGLVQSARLAGEIAGSPLAGVLAALAVAAAPPLLLGGFNAYPETVVVAVLPWLMRAGLALSWAPRTSSVVALGLVAGSLPWLHPKFLLLTLACLAVLGARLRTRRTWLVALGLAAALPLGALLLFQFAVSGLVRFDGLYVRCVDDLYGGASDFVSPAVLSGLMNALFGARDGLFVAAPVSLVAVLGLPWLWTRDRRAAIAILLAGGSVWFVCSLIGGGAGGPPGRLMGPVAALLVVPLAVGLAELHGHLPYRWLLTAAVLVSLSSVAAMRADWRRAVNPYRGVLTEATDFRRELPTEGREGKAAPRSLAQGGVLLAALSFWAWRFRGARAGGDETAAAAGRQILALHTGAWATAVVVAVALHALSPNGLQAADSWVTRRGTMEKASYGRAGEGEVVEVFTLRNPKGMAVRIATHGATIVSIEVPDRQGKSADVVLGFDDVEKYLGHHPHFGGVVGRYGNRIAKGRFSLGGVEYVLATNNGANHLHGGVRGFDRVAWSGRDASTAAVRAVELTYLSKDREEGYPGNLTAKVTYRLTDENELRLDYEATTDKDTVVNLTNHSYFNLAGPGGGDILGHVLTLDASRMAPVRADLIPTGELRAVEGTPFDFRKPAAVGARIDAKDEQLALAGGYDHTFVVDGTMGTLRRAARVEEPGSGRVMEVLTTEPGVQLYTGNNLDGTVKGKGGRVYGRRAGICFETQHYPDSPNQPAFPSTTLKAGGRYESATVFRFSTETGKP